METAREAGPELEPAVTAATTLAAALVAEPGPFAGAARLDPARVIALQRAAGNRAVGRWLLRAAQDNISTPIPSDATVVGANATVTIGGVRVKLVKDGKRKGGTVTQLRYKTTRKPNYKFSKDNDEVTDVTDPTVDIEIQTFWGTGDKPGDTSAYGRGTTEADKKAGNTSLRFHESCHGTDLLNYIRTHPPPTWGVTVGMNKDAAATETQRYVDALETWKEAAKADSTTKTDKVGTPGEHSD